jgi:hypothetical protein
MEGATERLVAGLRARPRALVLVSAVVVAVVTWLVLWSTVQPRAEWDSLIYHRLAFQYAGASEDRQIRDSFTIFERYADPAIQESVEEGIRRGGSVWEAFDRPERARWLGIYASRPLYPLVVAGFTPFLELRAPLAASALAVLIFTLAMLVGLGPVAGYATAAIAFALTVTNAGFNRWLVTLQTDGLSLALWAACLVLVARLVAGSRRGRTLGLLFAASIALVLARPVGMFLPVAIGLCFVAALPFNRQAAGRLLAASVVTGAAAALFLVYSRLAGLPGFEDVLQDLPTDHFTSPDVPNPLLWVWEENMEQIPNVLLPEFFGNPALWGPFLLGTIGLIAIGRSWWVAPFVIAPLVVALSYTVHPSLIEIPRNMAAAWISPAVGIGLLVVALVERLRALDRRLAGADGEPRDGGGGSAPSVA